MILVTAQKKEKSIRNTRYTKHIQKKYLKLRT